MQTDIYFEKNDKNTIISLEVPTASAVMIANAIKSMLLLAGHEIKNYKEIDFEELDSKEIEKMLEDAENEQAIPTSTIFADTSPAKALRGLRGKEGITQVALAKKLDITQTMISDMESGKRAISLKMAKRIGEVFNMSYKIFL